MSIPTLLKRQRFLERKQCLCGCGTFLKVHIYPHGKNYSFQVYNFVRGHQFRGIGGYDPNIHSPRLCACGCGNKTNKFQGRFCKFIKGHENRGRIPWNKGKAFSLESRKKMSVSHKGRSPVNKVDVDFTMLKSLYVNRRLNGSDVARALHVSEDVIKNRLREVGWSRTIKESCSSSSFKEKMRRIRVRKLSSQKVVACPNKLEREVYDFLDKEGIVYGKQVPLFDKFVVDVLFPAKKLVVEIFGEYWHTMPKIKQKDFSKKKYLEKCGYVVEEIWDFQIKKLGVENVFKEIFNRYNIVSS